MNPMKEALKKKKASGLNLTIILAKPDDKSKEMMDEESPEHEAGESPEFEAGEHEALAMDEMDDHNLDHGHKKKLMERAKLAAMGKR